MAKVVVVYAPDENHLEQILQALVETPALKHKTISTTIESGASVVFLTSPEELTPKLLKTSELIILPTTDLKSIPKLNNPLVVSYKPPTVQVTFNGEHETFRTTNKKDLLNGLSRMIQQFLGETS